MTTRDKGITLPFLSSYVNFQTASLKVTDVVNDYTSKNAWAYNPGGIQPINDAPIIATSAVVFTVLGQNATALLAAIGGSLYWRPGTGSGGNASGNVIIADRAGFGAAYNTSHIQMGSYHFWVDAKFRLRIKNGTPVSDTDGNVVGIDISGSAAYDPPSLADGAGVTTTVAAVGAVLGDFALVSFSLNLQGISVTAYVSAPDVVSVRLQNETGGVLDLAAGTLAVKVIKQ